MTKLIEWVNYEIKTLIRCRGESLFACAMGRLHVRSKRGDRELRERRAAVRVRVVCRLAHLAASHEAALAPLVHAPQHRVQNTLELRLLPPERALRVVRERLSVRHRPAQQRLPTARVRAHVECNTRTRRKRLLLRSGCVGAGVGAQERVERELRKELPLQLQELERLQVHAHDVRIGESHRSCGSSWLRRLFSCDGNARYSERSPLLITGVPKWTSFWSRRGRPGRDLRVARQAGPAAVRECPRHRSCTRRRRRRSARTRGCGAAGSAGWGGARWWRPRAAHRAASPRRWASRGTRVRRGSSRANIRRRAVVLEPVRSARRCGGGRVAVHPLFERLLLLEQKRTLERVYFARVFCKLTILN